MKSAVKTLGTCAIGASLTVSFGLANAADEVGTLSRIDGTAVVSQGAQYVEGREGMNLKEGDRLIVMEGGSAIIKFTDGCQYNLSDNELLTLGPTSTCASGEAGAYKIDPYTAVSQDPSAAAAGYQVAAVGDRDNDDRLAYVPLLGGGLVLIFAAAGGDDNNDRLLALRPAPPSP